MMSSSESESESETVPAKKYKSSCKYRLCGHCNRELNRKIFKEHKRLYYDETRKLWIKERNYDEVSSSDFSSLDELDLIELEGQLVESTNQSDRNLDSDEMMEDDIGYNRESKSTVPEEHLSPP